MGQEGGETCSAVAECSRSIVPARLQGKSEADVARAADLFGEIYQQIDSKQLKPFIRTQYMRSAFQVRRG